MNSMVHPSMGLRKMTQRDLPQVLAWRNHPEIRQHMYSSHEISDEEHADWFSNMSGSNNVELLIFKMDGVEVGYTKLEIDPETQTAQWGFYVCPNAPRGTGTRLGQAVIAHAFENRNIECLNAEVMMSNSRSIKFHEKMGFKVTKIAPLQPCGIQKTTDVMFLHLKASEFQKWHPNYG